MLDLFNVTYLRVYVYNSQSELVMYVDGKNDETVVQSAEIGIISQAIAHKWTLNVPCGQNHPEYNSSPNVSRQASLTSIQHYHCTFDLCLLRITKP